MKRLLPALLALTLSACATTSMSAGNAPADDDIIYCLFTIEGFDDCHSNIDGKAISVSLEIEAATPDESDVLAIVVSIDGTSQKLQLSNDVTIIDSDRGYIKLQDINFDGFRDIAITTSFAVANLYLDYWVYDPANTRFHYVGNFPDLTPIPRNETLTSTVKLNAESYSHSTWVWMAGDLVVKE